VIFSEKKFDESSNYFVERTRNSQLRKKYVAMHHGIVTIPPLVLARSPHFLARGPQHA
jgi:hypothetical protein